MASSPITSWQMDGETVEMATDFIFGGSKITKSLEDEECNGRPSEVDKDQVRAIIEADPFTTTQEIAKQLNVNHSMVVWYLKKIGKIKKKVGAS